MAASEPVAGDGTPSRRARLELRVFRRGLLAAVGHDLAFELPGFQAQLDVGRAHAEFDLASLRLLGVIRKGTVVRSEPSDADRATILDAAREVILQTARHPRATFDATLHVQGDRGELRGELVLRGRTAPVTLAFDASQGSTCVVRGEIAPSHWGIEPYKALAGALKLHDRVELRVELDVDAALRAAPLTGSARWTGTA